jgi:hypothetical protein
MILGYTERNMCLFISFGLTLGMWVLQRFSPKLKFLGFASAISFLMLFIFLKVHWVSPYANVFRHYFGIIVLYPGFIISSLLSNPWRATHSTDWRIVTFVISFLFNTVLLFGVFRGISYLKKKLSKHKTIQDKIPTKPD